MHNKIATMSKLKKSHSFSISLGLIIFGLFAVLFLALSSDTIDKIKNQNKLPLVTPDAVRIDKNVNSMASRSPIILYPARIEYPNEDYPIYKSLLQVVQEWNPDHPDAPAEFHETLQHFDYMNPYDLTMAKRFRDAEVPFKLYNVPEFNSTSKNGVMNICQRY